MIREQLGEAMADLFLDALAELDDEISRVEQLRQQDRDAMGQAIKDRADRLKASRESVQPLDSTATSAPSSGSSAPTPDAPAPTVDNSNVGTVSDASTPAPDAPAPAPTPDAQADASAAPTTDVTAIPSPVTTTDDTGTAFTPAQ